jgi:hypothetical protein
MGNSRDRRKSHRATQRMWGEKLTVLVVDWRMTHGMVADQQLKDAWLRDMKRGKGVTITELGWRND